MGLWNGGRKGKLVVFFTILINVIEEMLLISSVSISICRVFQLDLWIHTGFAHWFIF